MRFCITSFKSSCHLVIINLTNVVFDSEGTCFSFFLQKLFKCTPSGIKDYGGWYIGTNTFKNCLAAYTHKVKHVYALTPCNSFLWYITEMSVNHPSRGIHQETQTRDMNKNVPKCIIHNSPNWIQFKGPSRVQETNCSIFPQYCNKAVRKNEFLYTPHMNHIDMLSQREQILKNPYTMFPFIWSSKGEKLMYSHRCENSNYLCEDGKTGRRHEKTSWLVKI